MTAIQKLAVCFAVVVFMPAGLGYVDHVLGGGAEGPDLAQFAHNIGWALFGGALATVIYYKR